MKRRLGRTVLVGHGVLMFLFLYVPILVIVVYSFNSSRFSMAWEGFTLQWYQAMMGDRHLLRAVQNSLIIAAANTVISTVLGTLAAFALARHRFRGRGVVEALLYLPLILPDIVIGISLLALFSLTGVRLGIGTVIIAHVTFCASFVFVIVRARLQRFEDDLEKAAYDLGANEWQTFRWITLPLIAPAILAGALIAFTLSLDEVIITFFTAGPGASTLPLHIFSLLRLGVNPSVNALSTVILLVTFALIAGAWQLRQRRRRPTLHGDPPPKRRNSRPGTTTTR